MRPHTSDICLMMAAFIIATLWVVLGLYILPFQGYSAIGCLSVFLGGLGYPFLCAKLIFDVEDY